MRSSSGSVCFWCAATNIPIWSTLHVLPTDTLGYINPLWIFNRQELQPTPCTTSPPSYYNINVNSASTLELHLGTNQRPTSTSCRLQIALSNDALDVSFTGIEPKAPLRLQFEELLNSYPQFDIRSIDVVRLIMPHTQTIKWGEGTEKQVWEKVVRDLDALLKDFSSTKLIIKANAAVDDNDNGSNETHRFDTQQWQIDKFINYLIQHLIEGLKQLSHITLIGMHDFPISYYLSRFASGSVLTELDIDQSTFEDSTMANSAQKIRVHRLIVDTQIQDKKHGIHVQVQCINKWIDFEGLDVGTLDDTPDLNMMLLLGLPEGSHLESLSMSYRGSFSSEVFSDTHSNVIASIARLKNLRKLSFDYLKPAVFDAEDPERLERLCEDGPPVEDLARAIAGLPHLDEISLSVWAPHNAPSHPICSGFVEFLCASLKQRVHVVAVELNISVLDPMGKSIETSSLWNDINRTIEHAEDGLSSLGSNVYLEPNPTYETIMPKSDTEDGMMIDDQTPQYEWAVMSKGTGSDDTYIDSDDAMST